MTLGFINDVHHVRFVLIESHLDGIHVLTYKSWLLYRDDWRTSRTCFLDETNICLSYLWNLFDCIRRWSDRGCRECRTKFLSYWIEHFPGTSRGISQNANLLIVDSTYWSWIPIVTTCSWCVSFPTSSNISLVLFEGDLIWNTATIMTIYFLFLFLLQS